MKEECDIKFWSNPSHIIYKIYLCFKDGKYNGKYRLIEEDDWDEFHKVEILNNVSLSQIFIYLDLIGCMDRLVDRLKWEYGLEV